MKHINVGVTTEVIRVNGQYIQIAKEALDSMVAQIEGPEAIPVTIEHDWTIPPCGKILRGGVRLREDGEYEIFEEVEYFEKKTEFLVPDMGSLIAIESEEDFRPFKSRPRVNVTTLHIDSANFRSKEELQQFLSEARESGEFEHADLSRFSQVPDPILFLQVVVGGKFLYDVTKKVSEKLSDKIADSVVASVAQVTKLATTSFEKLLGRSSEDQNPTTIMCIQTSPCIEFVFFKADRDMEGLSEEAIRTAVERAEWLDSKFNADRIQFHFLDGSWKLNFLLTKDGKIIGTDKAFSRQSERMNQLRKNRELLELNERNYESSDS